MDLVIVDDDRVVIAMFNRVLKRTNISYCCFTASDEASLYLSKNQTSILIVDYRMPKADGLTLIESIPEANKCCIQMIYLCSSIELPPEVKQRALAHDVTPILKKDIMNKEYVENIMLRH